jgi:excisionase family DNA binding protein
MLTKATLKTNGLKKMLTSSQLATALGLTKITVLKMANEGLIPCYKLTTNRGDFRFDVDEVRAVLKAEALKKVAK